MTETRTPFDIDRAKAGDPVETRDYRTFVFGGYNPKAYPSQQVVGWIDDCIQYCHSNGRIFHIEDRPTDLFMAPRTKTLWVGIAKHGNPRYTTDAFETEDAAERASSGITMLGIYPIEVKLP